ncbi:hypothetical protein VBM87_02780 [Mycoplasma sp. 744]|uniref:hypothetical protein n=1 Tax=Mycoplasma sp. 744 TaxID=3108531 RepID=UPI002B1D94AB|nr:hypothetical protein [Mycoplasma sp. 744]MEA4115692.1 hypothetical protein [Mycoplasma sp. 744]
MNNKEKEIKAIVILHNKSLKKINNWINIKETNNIEFLIVNNYKEDKDKILNYLKEKNINLDYVMLLANNLFKKDFINKFTFSYTYPSIKNLNYKYYTSRLEQDGFDEAIKDYLYRIKLPLEKQQLAQKLERQKNSNKY